MDSPSKVAVCFGLKKATTIQGRRISDTSRDWPPDPGAWFLRSFAIHDHQLRARSHGKLSGQPELGRDLELVQRSAMW